MKSDIRHPLDFRHAVDFGIVGAVAVALLLTGTKVDAAGQLADEQQIDAFEQIGAQRRVLRQRRIGFDRAQVGEQLKVLADFEQSLLRANCRRRVIPLGTADRAQQNRVGLLGGAQRLIGQRRAGLVDGDSADQRVFEAEFVPVLRGDFLQHGNRRRRHLNADAVAR